MPGDLKQIPQRILINPELAVSAFDADEKEIPEFRFSLLQLLSDHVQSIGQNMSGVLIEIENPTKVHTFTTIF